MKSFKQFITEGKESDYDGMARLTKFMLPLDREKEGRDRILKMIDGWKKENTQEKENGS